MTQGGRVKIDLKCRLCGQGVTVRNEKMLGYFKYCSICGGELKVIETVYSTKSILLDKNRLK